MPINFYSFLIGSTLAEKEFEAKGAPNRDRSRQLGLLAAIFSPGGGGGLGSSVLPAVIVQHAARREAEEAAKKPAFSTSSGSASGSNQTPQDQTSGDQTPGDQTPEDETPVSPEDFGQLEKRVQSVEANVKGISQTLDAAFAPYPNLKSPQVTIGDARKKLQADYQVQVTQGVDTDYVTYQWPDPAKSSRLARGSTVVLKGG